MVDLQKKVDAIPDGFHPVVFIECKEKGEFRRVTRFLHGQTMLYSQMLSAGADFFPQGRLRQLWIIRRIEMLLYLVKGCIAPAHQYPPGLYLIKRGGRRWLEPRWQHWFREPGGGRVLELLYLLRSQAEIQMIES